MGQHMRQTLGRLALAALTLTLMTSVSTYAFAQEGAGSTAAAGASDEQAQIQDAAKKAYQAIADSKIDDLWTLVQSKYDRKLAPEKLKPSETGPKVSVAFDGNVKVLRVGKKDAVVSANFFKPDSNDIPASEVSRLDLYMVNDHGAWKIGAPDKKEAAFDGDKGGWYHSGSFTFCPNKGMVFLGNHFSSKTDCDATAVCRW
jgi:hypothetical protein